jgi:hypothetical protein
MEKVTIQFDADLGPLQDKLGQLKNSGLEQLSTGANEASSSIDKLSQSAKNMPMNVISQGFDEATTSIKENSQAITENVGKQQSMKAELKQLKRELQELEDQGKDNTKEFEQMAIQAGRLYDQIGDTQSRIKALGDDSKYIKTVSQAIGAMASAYSVAQGALALFGSENKEVEKALLKVNAAMAIANGLQQINEVLQKQSTLSVVANTVAQRAYTFVVGESTGALKVFRVALASTGIGLIVLAVGALVANWKEFVGWLTKSFPQLEMVTKFFTNFRQIAAGTLEAIVGVVKQFGQVMSDIFTGNWDKLTEDIKQFGKIASEKFNEAYNEEDRKQKIKAGLESRKLAIELAEKQGRDVNQMKLQLMQDELSILEKGSEDYNKKLVEIEGVRADIKKKQSDKDKKQLERDNEQRINDIDASYQKEIVIRQEALAKMNQDSAEARDLRKEIIDAQYAYDLLQLSNQSKNAQDYENKAKELRLKANKEKSAIDKQYLDAYSQQYSAWIKSVTDAEQKRLDEAKANRQAALVAIIQSIQTIANAEFEIDKANRDAKLQADIDALEQRKENELKNKNLTEAQKLAIQTKYDKLEAEQKKKAWEAEQDAKKKQAIINGALAITQIWATNAGNPVYAGILTAASIIATATQVRVIDSQPVPKFAKGKNLDGYEGMAIIGEAGRELRLDSDGSMKMYNRATLDHVNADSIILPNNLTEALLKTNIPAMNLRNMNAVTKQNISAKLDIDYKKLARTLGEELKNSQKVSVNIDEKGFETRIMNGISERRVIDNRYKL